MNTPMKTALATGLLVILLAGGFCASAQKQVGRTERKQADRKVDEGNRLYDAEQYTDAEISYRRALESEPGMTEGTFNMGNATYRQERWDEAMENYRSIASSAESEEVRAKAWHNLGNAHVQKQELDKAVDAYKQALRLNPNDLDTKYNLAWAKREQQQQEQQQQDQQDQEGEDEEKQENQDPQEGDQDQDGEKGDEKSEEEQEGEQGDQQEQEGEGDQQDESEQQPEEGKKQERNLSPDELERILQALDQDEKDVQKKVNAQRVEPSRVKVEKDW
jgi:tetratricopeptide (TPR) repeat protein